MALCPKLLKSKENFENIMFGRMLDQSCFETTDPSYEIITHRMRSTERNIKKNTVVPVNQE
jgi:hypothetical protein